jgi:hypothetical protein
MLKRGKAMTIPRMIHMNGLNFFIIFLGMVADCRMPNAGDAL